MSKCSFFFLPTQSYSLIYVVCNLKKKCNKEWFLVHEGSLDLFKNEASVPFLHKTHTISRQEP